MAVLSKFLYILCKHKPRKIKRKKTEHNTVVVSMKHQRKKFAKKTDLHIFLLLEVADTCQ